MKFMENDLTVDRDMYISELQNYLRTIAAYRDNVPVIGVDGIYGQHTALAVSAFQHGANLPVTGITDLDTWNAIFAAYSEIRQRSPRQKPCVCFRAAVYCRSVTAATPCICCS